jgi:hypothetical protein
MAHHLAFSSVLAAILIGVPIFHFVHLFACGIFDPCPTPAYFATGAD